MRKKSSQQHAFERNLAITIAVTAALSLLAILLTFLTLLIVKSNQEPTSGSNDVTSRVMPQPQSPTTTETSKYWAQN